jgi:hypothetical protein
MICNFSCLSPALASGNQDSGEDTVEPRTLVQKLAEEILGPGAAGELKDKDQSSQLMVKINEALEASQEDLQISAESTPNKTVLDSSSMVDAVQGKQNK